MKPKVFEVRDRGTFIPVLAIDMNPTNEGQRYLFRRAGYSCSGDTLVVFTYMHAKGHAFYDPYDWTGSRTMRVAHDYVAKNWDKLNDGDVIDVEFILGETTKIKRSERYDGGIL